MERSNKVYENKLRYQKRFIGQNDDNSIENCMEIAPWTTFFCFKNCWLFYHVQNSTMNTAGASDDYPLAKYQLSRRDRNSVQNTQHGEHWASPREFCSYLEFFKSGEREVGKICSYKTDKLARGNDINGR